MWDGIMFRFCKADYLCWNGEPHWLGYVVMIYIVFKVLQFMYKLLANE